MSTLNTETILLETLANGFDPTTGFPLSKQSKYHNRDVKKLIFHIINYLQDETERSDFLSKKQKSNILEGKPKNFQIRWGDIERENMEDDYIYGFSIEQLCNLYGRNKRSVIDCLKLSYEA